MHILALSRAASRRSVYTVYMTLEEFELYRYSPNYDRTARVHVNTLVAQ